MRSMRFVLALVLVLAACVRAADVPTTSKRFRSLSKTKPDLVQVQKLELRIPYLKAMANLQTYSDKCLNFYRHHSVGGGVGYSMTYSSRLVPASGTNAELSLTFNGAYQMVTDVESLPGNRTRVTVYAHEDLYFEEVPGWASGKRNDC
jgi:hypothetical protein